MSEHAHEAGIVDLLEDAERKLKIQYLLNLLLLFSVILLLISSVAQQPHIIIKTIKVSDNTDLRAPNIVRQWEAVKDHLDTGKSRFKTLKEINDYINKFPYKDDDDVWGVPNYWETPREFFMRGSGQCQDYVIVKYALALEAGLTTKTDAKLELAQDKKSQEYHMLLIIGDSVLDNQNKEIATVDKAKKRYKMLGEVREIVSKWEVSHQ